jgi:hypothetical protein
VYFKVSGEDILPLDWGRKHPGGIAALAHDKLDQIVIEVDLRYHVQVEIAPDLADEVRAEDARGGPVLINVFEGNTTMTTDSVRLVDGRSKVMVVAVGMPRRWVLEGQGRSRPHAADASWRGELNVLRF